MGRLSDDFIADLRDRADVYETVNALVPLKKTGAHNFSACCPFHDEKSPSFTVNTQKNFFYCFGCGAGGDALTFLMDYSRLEFREAVDVLAKQVGVTVPATGPVVEKTPAQKLAPEAVRLAARFFYQNLQRDVADEGAFFDYLVSRDLGTDLIKRFGLGCVADGNALQGHLGASFADALRETGLVTEKGRDLFFNRLMFPVRNVRGEVVGFSGRVLDDAKPKYVNSADSAVFDKSRVLYGLFEALQADRKPELLCVVEGCMDVVGLARGGFDAAVAGMGTAFTPEQARLAYRYVDELVFCFDGDEPGIRAAERALVACAPFVDAGKACRFVFLPQGQDPDTFIAAEGLAAFNALLDDALDIDAAICFLAQQGIKRPDSISGKNKVLNRAMSLTAEFSNGPLVTLIKKAVGKQLGLSAKDLNSPRAPKDGGLNVGGKGLDADFIERFALVEASTNVYDRAQSRVLKKAEFGALVGKAKADLWFAIEAKPQISEVEAFGLGSDNPLERWVYLSGTEEAWDHVKHRSIPLRVLKAELADRYNIWFFSRERKQIDIENLVFDPCGEFDGREGYINKFKGLTLQPLEGDLPVLAAKCKPILDLLDNLCNSDQKIIKWVLCWLAYPLQNIGAKLDTSLLFHGELEGTGKTLFFSKIMGGIYGEYGGEFGQAQIDSAWNSWQSQKLWGMFDEVVSKGDKYSAVAQLKQLVTSEKTIIQRKFCEAQAEANHLNAVFASNDNLPFSLSPFDRRWLVLRPRTLVPVALQQAVDECLHSDGLAAFYGFLLQVDLRVFEVVDGEEKLVPFGPRTKPPLNDDKQQLIDFGMPGWRVFLRSWVAGELVVPVQACTTEQLYRLYVDWNFKAGYKGKANRNQFVLNVDKEPGFGRAKMRYRQGEAGSTRHVAFIVPDGCVIAERKQFETLEDYASACVASFEQAFAGGFGE